MRRDAAIIRYEEDCELKRLWLKGEISTRAAKAVLRKGCKTIEDVRRLGRIEPGMIRNCGPNTIDELNRLISPSHRDISVEVFDWV